MAATTGPKEPSGPTFTQSRPTGHGGSFVLVMAGSNPSWVECLSSGACAYRVFQTVQRTGVCSSVYGTLHYKKNLAVI